MRASYVSCTLLSVKQLTDDEIRMKKKLYAREWTARHPHYYRDFSRRAAAAKDKRPRQCQDCAGDISHRTRGAKRCESCAKLQVKKTSSARSVGNTACTDCKEPIVSISKRIKYCEKCARIRELASKKKYNHKESAKVLRCETCTFRLDDSGACSRCITKQAEEQSERERAKRLADRLCMDCFDAIGHRVSKCVRCEPCQHIHWREQIANWWPAHRDKRRAKNRNRRAMERNQGPGVSEKEWNEILSRHDGGCAYCENAAETMDHILALSKGGMHAPENVIPACLKCNSSKWNSDQVEWMTRTGRSLRKLKQES